MFVSFDYLYYFLNVPFDKQRIQPHKCSYTRMYISRMPGCGLLSEYQKGVCGLFYPEVCLIKNSFQHQFQHSKPIIYILFGLFAKWQKT